MATRREKVILELDDRFTAPMMKAAAATELLNRQLSTLSDDAVRARGPLRVLSERSSGIPGLGASADKSSKSIDKLSGRLAILLRLAGALGPALVPITTAGVPAVAGLSTQLGFAALAGGTAIVAFQGVGDALKTMREAQLDPTTDNLEKAREAMELLSPAGRRLVRQLQDMGPALRDIRDAAQAGLFTGLDQGLESLEGLLPQIERIFKRVSLASGDLFASGAAQLAGDDWAEFFAFIEAEARPTLMTLGGTIGNLTKGMAELWMALDPLSDDFSGGLLQASQRFEDWAEGVSETQGFEEFLSYVQETGPQVLDTVGALADMLLQVAEAASPLGGPILEGIEAFANAVALVADSPLGPPIMAGVAAMSALNLAMNVFGKVSTSAWAANMRGAEGSIAAMGAAQKAASVTARLGGAGLAAIALQAQEAVTGFDATNTSMGIMIGTMGGPWGMAAGAVVGGLLDIKSASDETVAGLDDLRERIKRAMEYGPLTGAQIDDFRSDLDMLREASEAMADPPELGSQNVGDKSLVAAWHNISGAAHEAEEKADEAAAALDKAMQVDPAYMRTGPRAIFGGISNAADMAATSVDDFAASFQSLNDILENSGSLIAYERALDDLAASIRENGRAWDVGTRAGQDNLERRNTLVERAIARSEVLQKQGKILEAQKILGRAVQDLERFAGKSPKIKAILDDLKARLDDVDRTKAEPKVEPKGIGAASAGLSGLLAQVNALDGRRARITIERMTTYLTSGKPTTRTPSNADLGLPEALGGFYPRVRRYANGGMDISNRHEAEFARRPGAVARVWLEEETQGESYIPHANDHRRPRAKRTLEQTASLMGGRVEWYATGGRRGDDDAIRDLAKAARESARAMREEMQARRENLRSERRSLVESVQGKLRSDLFGQPDDVWSAGAAGGWRSALRADIAQARALRASTRRLKRKGLDGGALQDLLANGDPAVVRAFSTQTSAQLAQFERQWELRERLTRQAGRTAGNAVYGERLRRIERALHSLVKETKDAPEKTGRTVGRALSGVTRAGVRRGNR